MTTDTNFLGMPVSGDITHGSTRREQKPLEELAPLFQALIDDPTIVEFGWRQYTPYFNDGDTCEFGVNGLWARTTAEVDTDEEEFSSMYDLDVDYHPSLGKVSGHYEGEWPDRKFVRDGYEGPDEDRYNRCQELDGALQSGAFDNVLLDHFGDHALITVRKGSIEVEFHDHD
ncbi:hypothetical protein OG306_33290 [Streptomyces sp. NBC_01241]|uniref:hypothetical protein n=1 Tax=Streptomyces sp. NBC_01241 TaxID=2903794 RepID=UPI00352F9E08|nr:hypothetical protein OG306_33290 [Streptomyces sp. NBC_01241]